QRLDLAPAKEVLGVPVPGEILDDVDGQAVQLFTGKRRDSGLTEPRFDPLRDLVRAGGGEPGDHDLRGHQPLRIGQAGITIRDEDMRSLRVVCHGNPLELRVFYPSFLAATRSIARSIVSLNSVGRSASPSTTVAR